MYEYPRKGLAWKDFSAPPYAKSDIMEEEAPYG